MKKLIITLATVSVLALSGCDTLALVTDDIGDGKMDSAQPAAAEPVIEPAAEPVVEPVVAEVAQPPVSTQDIPKFWYMYPDGVGMCNGMYDSISIPCGDVLDVCVVHEGGALSSKWVPEFVRCTPQHPTWKDVCLTVDPIQWSFYGYTPEECSAVLTP